MVGGLSLNQSMFAANVIDSRANKTHNFDLTDTNTAILDGTALVSAGIRLPGGGMMSASVFKSANFTADNPIMLVRGINVDGSPFEVEVNVNEVNPKNASFIEMFALDGYFENKGQNLSAVRNAVIAMAAQESQGKSFGFVDAFVSQNFVSPLQEMMKNQRALGNWEVFMRLNYIIENLLSHLDINRLQ